MHPQLPPGHSGGSRNPCPWRADTSSVWGFPGLDPGLRRDDSVVGEEYVAGSGAHFLRLRRNSTMFHRLPGGARGQLARTAEPGRCTLNSHRVIPADAGIHVRGAPIHPAYGVFLAWILAFAGMTPWLGRDMGAGAFPSAQLQRQPPKNDPPRSGQPEFGRALGGGCFRGGQAARWRSCSALIPIIF
jgi:hypothetical protein